MAAARVAFALAMLSGEPLRTHGISPSSVVPERLAVLKACASEVSSSVIKGRSVTLDQAGSELAGFGGSLDPA